MNFRTRLTLTITALLFCSVLITAFATFLNARSVMLEGAVDSGRRIAILLTRSAEFSNRISADIEDIIAQMMLGQATITSHYVDAAERAGDNTATIKTHLKAIVQQTNIDEFWITDPQGKAYLHNVDFEFAFGSDPIKQPQAYEFWSLISGDKTSVVQKARKREYDGKPFKYVGVPGIDHPRIVQVGVQVNLLEDIKVRIGLSSLVKTLVAPGDINAIWVLSEQLDTMAHASIYGTEYNAEPSKNETLAAQDVVKTGIIQSFVDNGQLTVLAPIIQDGVTLGSVIVRLSTEHQDAAFTRFIIVTAAISFSVLLIGGALSVMMSRHITDPVMQVAEAALAIELGTFEPSTLDRIVDRGDELGKLASVFITMAHTVLAREEHLDGLIKVRTAELEEKNEKLVLARQDAEIALGQLQEAQSQLVESEKMAALGGLVAGVAHEINTPVGNSLTVATTLRRRTSAFETEVQTGTLRKSTLAAFSADITNATEQLESNLTRAAELIQSFKQVALDRGSMDRREFQIKHYVQDLLASLQTVVRKYPVSITVDIPEDISINGYPGAFGQVITNLIMNTLTHAFDPQVIGQANGQIAISGQQIDPDWMELSFADDGIGISVENQNKVFEPFFTTKRGEGGSGLGLHVVFNLVTQTLGGSIALESAVHQGTTFFIRLPLKSPANVT